MKTVIKKVYYCDFCGKRYLGKGWIIKHEKHCTKNPDRYCRLCDRLEGGQQNDIKKLIKKYKNTFEIKETEGLDFTSIKVNWKDKPVTLDDILKETNCPACTLAILRLVFTPFHIFEMKFNYKEALDNVWHDINNRERDWGGGYY